MTIYLDVLLLTNFWADYALLRACGRLTGAPLRRMRLLLGGLLGAAGALAVFLPAMPLPVCMLGRLLLALGMTAAAFGYHGLRRLLRQTGVLYLLSMLFAGVMLLLAQWAHPVGFYAQNTVCYADLSLTVLLGGTALGAAIASFLAHRGSGMHRAAYRLHLRIGGCDLCMPALSDTGSTLRDAYSGLPVIVCTERSLSAWLGQYPDAASAAASQKGFRLLPVRTVSGQTVLPAFQPELLAVSRAGKPEIPLGAMVAVSHEEHGDTPAVIPAALLAGI